MNGLGRHLGALTICLMAMTVCTLATRSWMLLPAGVGLVIVCFAWQMQRADFSDHEGEVSVSDLCRGCRGGCVECREHLDAEAA